MKENRLINFRENYFVWLLLLYFSFVGVALLSRLFEWDEVLKVIDILKLGYPLRKLTGPYTEKIALPLSLFHFGLGLVGCVLLFYKPRLADLGIIKFEEKEHTRFNLLIISSFLSIYVFGLYNLPELIIGLRVPIFLQDTLFDYLTSVNFLISGLLFLIISIYILILLSSCKNVSYHEERFATFVDHRVGSRHNLFNSIIRRLDREKGFSSGQIIYDHASLGVIHLSYHSFFELWTL